MLAAENDLIRKLKKRARVCTRLHIKRACVFCRRKEDQNTSHMTIMRFNVGKLPKASHEAPTSLTAQGYTGTHNAYLRVIRS